MCGIVGYIGKRKASEVITNGLERLEYRGYDSSGIALFHNDKVEVYKASGKLKNLKEILSNDKNEALDAHLGIGHIRWATHGLPTTVNAHPHVCNCGSLALVHNGIIENYTELKEELVKKGAHFVSQTDTEVAAHLIAYEYAETNNLLEAVTRAIRKIEGAFAFCVIHKKCPDRIITARKNAPLIIGVGEGENFIASDIPAIIDYTKKAIYLNDGQIALVTKDNVEIHDIEGNVIQNKVEYLPFEPIALSKMGYKHFMLKEIHEQPDVVRNALNQKLISKNEKINLAGINLDAETIKKFNRVQIIACGTSLHAGLVGKYVIEDLVGIPVDVEASSEYIYRKTIADENTLVIGISQSGETADTITAIKQVMKLGAHVLIITNRTDSCMARLADSLFGVEAGMEVSVAATKSYTAQLLALYLLALYLAEEKGKNLDEVAKIKEELTLLPSKMEKVLNNTGRIADIAKRYSSYKNFIFIARGVNYASALEGALKLKEISYINATGYSAGELKHGPIAMLDESMPVLAILNKGLVYDKVLSNCQESKARQAKLIAVTNVLDDKNDEIFDDKIEIPEISDILSPALNVIVLQLLAYYIAEYLGKDVDQPRNLAKSVTVE